MNIEEWMKQLSEASVDAEGFSASDLRKILGLSEDAVGRKLRQWVERGLVEHVGFRSSHSITGRPITVPVYQLKGNTNGKQKGRKEVR
jgi:predicted ArsR family transcriptional regulator